jgi:hypothetical protein
MVDELNWQSARDGSVKTSRDGTTMSVMRWKGGR